MRNLGKGFTARKAFTLLEMAVVLVIMGLMTTMIIQSQKTAKPSNCYATTQAQMASIQTAIDHFVRTNNYYPAPARRNLGVSNSNFGVPVTTPIESFTNSGTGKTTLYGALPFQVLGLPSSFAADCWGNLFSYIVTRDLIQPGTASPPTLGYNDPATQGAIIIHSGTYSVPTTIMTNAAYAVISHGETGGQANGGAVPKNNTGAVGWCTGTAHRDNYNCNLQDQLVTATFNNGANAGGNFFDDLIVFAPKALSSCNGRNVPVTWTNASANLSCNGVAAVAAPLGSTPETVTDSTAPTTGSAQFTCAGGQYTTVGTPTCVGPCMPTTLTWGSGCSATFAQTSANSDSGVTGSTQSGYSGNAQAHCNADGSWGTVTPTDTCTASGTTNYCGSSAGGVYSTMPTTNLCANGANLTSGPTDGGSIYTWNCTDSGNNIHLCTANMTSCTYQNQIITYGFSCSSHTFSHFEGQTCNSPGDNDPASDYGPCTDNNDGTYTGPHLECTCSAPAASCGTLPSGLSDDTTIRNDINASGCSSGSAAAVTQSGTNYAWKCGSSNCSYAATASCTWQNVTAYLLDSYNYCGASSTHAVGDPCTAAQVGDTDPTHNYGTCSDQGVDSVWGGGDMEIAQHLECFCGAPPPSLCPSYNYTTIPGGDRDVYVFVCANGATAGNLTGRTATWLEPADGYEWQCIKGGVTQLCHVELYGTPAGVTPACGRSNGSNGMMNPYACDVGTISDQYNDNAQRTCDQFRDRMEFTWKCNAGGTSVDCMDIESSCP